LSQNGNGVSRSSYANCAVGGAAHEVSGGIVAYFAASRLQSGRGKIGGQNMGIVGHWDLMDILFYLTLPGIPVLACFSYFFVFCVRLLNETILDPDWLGDRRLKKLGKLVKEVLADESVEPPAKEQQPSQLDEVPNVSIKSKKHPDCA
jgi:hypothetical protein